MSQNAHRLLLFFPNAEQYKNCLRILKLLHAERSEEAARLGQEWGVDFVTPWNNEWFNHSFEPTPKFIRLYYETRTDYELPLELLQQLFDVGLRAACLEIYYDQTGEYGQFYFVDGTLVTKETLCTRFGAMRRIIEEEFQSRSADGEADRYPRPSSIAELIKANAERESNSEDVAEAMAEEMGPAFLVQALRKGLFHSLGFGVVTVLLFKGMWLWIGLSILLAIFLPMSYFSKARADFKATIAMEKENVDGN